jgi:hypothetical protein
VARLSAPCWWQNSDDRLTAAQFAAPLLEEAQFIRTRQDNPKRAAVDAAMWTRSTINDGCCPLGTSSR